MATRFYLPSSGAAAVSPAYDSAWDDTTHAGSRLRCVTTKISSTMGSVGISGDSDKTDKDYLIQQWVSDPIIEQSISIGGVDAALRCMETANANDLYLAISVRVVSNDGSTVRGTLKTLARDTNEVDVTLVNRFWGPFSSTAVDAEEGDRIVIEIGLGGDPGPPADHDGEISIGDDSGTDLPEDDSTTSAYNPWVELSVDITFQGGDVTVTPGAVTAVSAVVAPSVVHGSVSVTPSPVTAVSASVAPTVIHGSLNITPAAAAAISSAIDPTVQIGDITVTPNPATAVAGIVAPGVVLGSTTATPAPAAAVGAVVAPTVVHGSISITPTPASAVGAVVAPTVQEGGSIIYTPAEASAVGAVVAPGVVQSSMTVTPTPAASVGAVVAPSVVQGSLTLTPTPASSVGAIVAPTVVLGSTSSTPAAVTAVGAVYGPIVDTGQVTGDYVNIYSAALNTGFDGTTGSISIE